MTMPSDNLFPTVIFDKKSAHSRRVQPGAFLMGPDCDFISQKRLE